MLVAMRCVGVAAGSSSVNPMRSLRWVNVPASEPQVPRYPAVAEPPTARFPLFQSV